MTPELQQRLSDRRPPFDGVCVHSAVELNLSQLRELLAVSIAALSLSSSEIFSFRDWHEHDGYLVGALPATWDTLRSAVASDRALFESRDGDWEVRNAYFSASFQWLLRYNVDEDDETDHNSAGCDFDLSVAADTESSPLIQELLSGFPDLLVRDESQTWFQGNYGG